MTGAPGSLIILELSNTMSHPKESKNPATTSRKPLRFVGSSLKDLRAMPPSVQDAAGRLLLDVQHGETPASTEAINRVGEAVVELKVDDRSGWFRFFYVAKFEEAVYLLHSFQKTTNAIAQQDIDTARRRYAAVITARQKP